MILCVELRVMNELCVEYTRYFVRTGKFASRTFFFCCHFGHFVRRMQVRIMWVAGTDLLATVDINSVTFQWALRMDNWLIKYIRKWYDLMRCSCSSNEWNEFQSLRINLPIVFLFGWIDELPISADGDDFDIRECSKLVTLVDVSPAFDPIDGAASVTPVHWTK